MGEAQGPGLGPGPGPKAQGPRPKGAGPRRARAQGQIDRTTRKLELLECVLVLVAVSAPWERPDMHEVS